MSYFNKPFAAFILVFFVLWGCKEKNEQTGGEGEYEEALVFTFQENQSPIPAITSFDFIDDASVVITTDNNQVWVYGREGEQKFEIKAKGEGELELLKPNKARVWDGEIYVWCSSLLKMVVFDRDGQALRAISGFDKAIRDFKVDGDYVALLTTGRTGENFITLYDKEQGEIVERFGSMENEQMLLNLRKGNEGGLAFTGEQLLFTPAHTLEIQRVGLSHLQDEAVKKIADEDFKVEPYTGDVVSFVNNERAKAFDYSWVNSAVTGMWSSDNHVLLATEVGEFDVQTYDNSKRFEKLFLFDKELNLLKSFKLPHDYGSSNALMGSFKKDFYRIKAHVGEEEMVYGLYKVNF